jgi:hypothetical protein
MGCCCCCSYAAVAISLPLLLLLLLTFEVAVQRLHHVMWQLQQATPLLRHGLGSFHRHHHMLQCMVKNFTN